MGIAIKQYRYYDQNSSSNGKNYPSTISLANLASGSIFFPSDGNLHAIQKLGIQTLPGVKFYLNSNPKPIIVGATGIYELDLEGQAEITALSFEVESLAIIDQLANGYIIVDAIYSTEDV